jgi:hypothetical protein
MNVITQISTIAIFKQQTGLTITTTSFKTKTSDAITGFPIAIASQHTNQTLESEGTTTSINATIELHFPTGFSKMKLYLQV